MQPRISAFPASMNNVSAPFSRAADNTASARRRVWLRPPRGLPQMAMIFIADDSSWFYYTANDAEGKAPETASVIRQ
jgi:hypothetical protein